MPWKPKCLTSQAAKGSDGQLLESSSASLATIACDWGVCQNMQLVGVGSTGRPGLPIDSEARNLELQTLYLSTCSRLSTHNPRPKLQPCAQTQSFSSPGDSHRLQKAWLHRRPASFRRRRRRLEMSSFATFLMIGVKIRVGLEDSYDNCGIFRAGVGLGLGL